MLTSTDFIKAASNGINASALKERIKMGWEKERALTQPIRKSDRSKWLKIALKNGIEMKTFDARVTQYGWSYERAATQKVRQRKVNQNG